MRAACSPRVPPFSKTLTQCPLFQQLGFNPFASPARRHQRTRGPHPASPAGVLIKDSGPGCQPWSSGCQRWDPWGKEFGPRVLRTPGEAVRIPYCGHPGLRPKHPHPPPHHPCRLRPLRRLSSSQLGRAPRKEMSWMGSRLLGSPSSIIFNRLP